MPALAIADETIGALSFFRDHADDLDEDDINADQCLADVTIIAILRYRARIDLGALKHRLLMRSSTESGGSPRERAAR